MRSSSVLRWLAPLAGVVLAACSSAGKDTTSSGSGGASSSTSSGTTQPGTGGTGGSTPVTPTVSSWMGTNVAADMPRVDITYQLKPFDTPADKKDQNGYPAAGQSGTSSTDIGFVLPGGTYKIAYKGTGKLTISGIGKLAGTFTDQGGEHRADLQITGTPGAFGNFLTLAIENGPGQTVESIRILAPGFDYDTQAIFLPGFLKLLEPFRALRFMEWQNTNGNTITAWSDAPRAAHFGASDYGEPFEHITALVNETGKDCWVTVPEHATDDFIDKLADFLAQGLDFAKIDAARAQRGQTLPFQVIVENSNETWNNGFTAFATFNAAAKQNPSRYTGKYTGTYGPDWMAQNADLVRVGQYQADRLVTIAGKLRAAFAKVGKESVVAPVLSGWALGAAYSDFGLTFIQDNFGDPKKYVSYIALAPYFGAEDAQTSSLEALFQSAAANIQSMDGAFGDFHDLGAAYGIPIAAYEGGQSLTGTENQSIKHLAQHDQRMYATYEAYFDLWKKHFGASLFMHFDLAGTPGIPELIFQYGYWGSIISALEDPAACSQSLPMLTGTEEIASVIHHCPKYRSLMEKVPQ
ncbi:Cellulose-binding domain protein [Minicystis rosea]|nr:Cellulose-binding domain protein [Minicystis rosea]